MSVVGSAYVVVRAISPSVRKDIAKAASEAAKAAAPAMAQVHQQVGDSIGKAAREGAEKAGKAAAPAARSAGMEIGEAMANGMPGGFTKRARGSLGKALTSVANAAKPDEQGRGMGLRMGRGYLTAISKFRIPPIAMLAFLGIPAIGGALQIIAAYAASAVSLIGAIGPAFAAVGGIGVASFLTLGGAVGAVMLALKTASPMLNRFKIAAGAVGKEFSTIGLAVQKVLLPPLAQAMGQLTSAIPTLRTGMVGLGTAVGGVAVNLSKVVTSAPVLRDLSQVFAQGGPQITNYGGALGNVLQVIVAIGAAAAPFATQFSAFLNRFTASMLAATRAGQESGALAGFMQRAYDVAKQLSQIIGDLGRGLFNTFSAASGSGQVLLDSISAIATKFAEWSGSVAGQNSLKTFFDNALPVVREFNGLIGDVFKAIGAPLATGDNAGVIAFIRALRTDVLPALQQIGDAASSLGPSLLELTSAFADLISAMADSGALGAFTGTLVVLIKGITELLALPVIGQIAGWGLAFAGMAKAADMVTFGASTNALKSMGDALFKVQEGANKSRAAIVLQGAASKIAAAATKAWTGIQWALNAAFVGNPVGIVIAVIVALVAAIVIAYNKSDRFRAIVDKLGAAIMGGLRAALEWLKGAWDSIVSGLQAAGRWFEALGDSIMGGLRAALEWLRGAWDSIVAGFQTAVQWVQNVLNAIAPLVNALTQPWQGIAQFFTGIWQIISGIFTGNLDQITTGVANAIGGIVRFFLGLPSRILQAILGLGPMLAGWATTAWTFVSTAFMTGVDNVVAFFTALPGRVIAAVSSLLALMGAWISGVWTAVTSAVTTGIDRNIAFFRALPGRVIAAVTTLISLARTWMNSTWNAIISAVTTGIDRNTAFWRALPGRVISAVSSLAGTIRSTAAGWLTAMNSAISSGISNAIGFFIALPGRILSALGNLGNLLSSAGRSVVEGLGRGITDALGGLLRTAREMAGKIAAAVKDALKVNSPSKVMIPLGKAVGEGLQVGMEKMMTPVGRTGANLAMASVVSPPQSSFARGAAAAGSIASPGFALAGAGAAEVHLHFDVNDLRAVKTVEEFLGTIESRIKQKGSR